MNEIREYLESELTVELAGSIASVMCNAFSSSKSLEQRIEILLNSGRGQGLETDSSRRFVIWDGPRAVAHAQTFIRVVKVDGQQIPVLALAGVCSDPTLRGKGLGAKVTRCAFEQLGDDGWPDISLFQTSVPGFYEKLGGRLVANPFVNRLNADDPQANPWRDDSVVMVYPATCDWPEGTVDLNGPCY